MAQLRFSLKLAPSRQLRLMLKTFGGMHKLKKLAQLRLWTIAAPSTQLRLSTGSMRQIGGARNKFNRTPKQKRHHLPSQKRHLPSFCVQQLPSQTTNG